MRLVLFWHVFPIAAAIALLGLLVVSSDLTIVTVGAVLSALTWGHVAGFMALTMALLILSAVKWNLVMGGLPGPPARVPSLVASFFYTCLGAALSLVFMPHIATPTGRALGARLHGAAPIGRSVGASLFEQVFDLAVVVLFAAAGLAIMLPGAAPYAALTLCVGTAAAMWVVRHPARLPHAFRTSGFLDLLGTRIALRLVTISLIRYSITAVRGLMIAAPAGLLIAPPDFLASFSLVQISRVVAVTPMGLGITDWTWAGVLSLIDVQLTVAASFVLLQRCLNAAAILLALCISAVLVTFQKRLGP